MSRKTKDTTTHDGYPARYVGTHRSKHCKIGPGKGVVMKVFAPSPYFVCGCDERPMDHDIKFYPGKKRDVKPPRRPPFLTFCPYKVYNVRSEMCYTVEIVKNMRDGTPEKRMHLSALDVSYGVAEELRKFLTALFEKHESGHVWRAGSMIRREIERREGNVKGYERQASEERGWIARLTAELHERGDKR